jgi:DNA repair exonuclease SbcCD ATPase subunit
MLQHLMSDDASTKKLSEHRRREAELKAEVRKLESQVSLLEKQLDARDDAGTRARLNEVENKLAAANEELLRVSDALEGTEAARAEAVASIEELEQLVDSFSKVTKGVPELVEVLSAMKLCVGALATARRLERTQESLQEAKDISAALTQALMLLANTLASQSGRAAVAAPKS